MAPPSNLLVLEPHQLVLLIAGPAASGKSSAAERAGAQEGWAHISEDDVWNEIGHPPEELRADSDQLVVHARVHQKLLQHLKAGRSVALEFILFHNPPWPLHHYRQFLVEQGVPIETRIIRPTLAQLVERAKRRGRQSDLVQVELFKANALHQLACLASVDPNWVVDSSPSSFEDFFESNFRRLVEMGQRRS